MPTAAKTYTFSPGLAKSAEVNQNFQDILDFLNLTKLDQANLQDNAVIARCIANGAVTLGKLATDSVDASKIVASGVGTSELANDSVTNDKLNLAATDTALGAPVAIGTSPTDIITVAAPTAGTYLVWAQLATVPGTGNAQIIGSRFSFDTADRDAEGDGGNSNVISTSGIVTLDGAAALKLKATRYGLGGWTVNAAQDQTRMLRLRIA